MGVMDKKSQKVYDWLRLYIDENKFSANTKLLSGHAVCAKLDVSRETVRIAEERLRKEDLIYKVKGSGTYINKAAALSKDQGKETAAKKSA